MVQGFLPPPDGDRNRGPTLLIIAILLTIFSWVTTSLRLSVRTIHRQLGLDDLFMGLATLFTLPQVVMQVLEVRNGNGRHAYYLTLEQFVDNIKWTYIVEFFLFLIICLTKISICFFILRIKKTGWLKHFLYALMGGLTITTVGVLVIWGAQCQPIKTYWDRPAGKCWDPEIYNNLIWVQVSYSVFSDLVCSLLPVVVLWNIQISTKLKFAVCGLMGMGLIATACAAVRASLSGNSVEMDLSWSLTIIDIWATLEQHLGIIAANLALSRNIYRWLRDGARAVTQADRTRASNYRSDFHSNHVKDVHRGLSSLSSRSQESQIPLEHQNIRKTTEFVVSQELAPGHLDDKRGWIEGHDRLAVKDLV